jgi:hypothetical protein
VNSTCCVVTSPDIKISLDNLKRSVLCRKLIFLIRPSVSFKLSYWSKNYWLQLKRFLGSISSSSVFAKVFIIIYSSIVIKFNMVHGLPNTPILDDQGNKLTGKIVSLVYV